MGNKFSGDTLTFTAEDGHRYWACFSYHDFYRGSKKRCFLGRLNGTGPHCGDKVVVKAMLGVAAGRHTWECEVKKAKTARRLAKTFLERHPDARARIEVILPSLAVLDTLSAVGDLLDHQRHVRQLQEDETVSIERYLPGTVYRFSPGGASYDVLEAFSHFTWHESGGQFVVCDMQGIREGSKYRVTDPTVHSTQREYGLDDEGPEGINTFFKLHQCTEFCRGWQRPVPLSPPPPPSPRQPDPVGDSGGSFEGEEVHTGSTVPGLSHHVNGNSSTDRSQEPVSSASNGQLRSQSPGSSQSSLSSVGHHHREERSAAATGSFSSRGSQQGSGSRLSEVSSLPNYDESRRGPDSRHPPTFYLERGASASQIPLSPPPPYEDSEVPAQILKRPLNADDDVEVCAPGYDPLPSCPSGIANTRSGRQADSSAARPRGARAEFEQNGRRRAEQGSDEGTAPRQSERGDRRNFSVTQVSDAVPATSSADAARRRVNFQATPPPSFEEALWLRQTTGHSQTRDAHGRNQRQHLSLAPSQSVTFSQELLQEGNMAAHGQRRQRSASWPLPLAGPAELQCDEESHYATVTACQNIILPPRSRRLQLMDIHHALAVRERRRRGQGASAFFSSIAELWRRGRGNGHAPRGTQPRPLQSQVGVAEPRSDPWPRVEPSAPPLTAEADVTEQPY